MKQVFDNFRAKINQIQRNRNITDWAETHPGHILEQKGQNASYLFKSLWKIWQIWGNLSVFPRSTCSCQSGALWRRPVVVWKVSRSLLGLGGHQRFLAPESEICLQDVWTGEFALHRALSLKKKKKSHPDPCDESLQSLQDSSAPWDWCCDGQVVHIGSYQGLSNTWSGWRPSAFHLSSLR